MANYYAAATDAQGRLTAPSVLSQIDARTKATMRADLPALAEELKIGGSGSGGALVEVSTSGVSPTPTVAPSGQTILIGERNAGATTITRNGATLAPGQFAVFGWYDGRWNILNTGSGQVNPPDTEAPTAPTIGAVEAAHASLRVSYSGGTDNVYVTKYRARAYTGTTPTGAWTVIESPAAGTVTLTGLTPSTAYTVEVQAGDAAGNWSPSATKQATTAVAPMEFKTRVFEDSFNRAPVARAASDPSYARDGSLLIAANNVPDFGPKWFGSEGGLNASVLNGTRLTSAPVLTGGDALLVAHNIPATTTMQVTATFEVKANTASGAHLDVRGTTTAYDGQALRVDLVRRTSEDYAGITFAGAAGTITYNLNNGTAPWAKIPGHDFTKDMTYTVRAVATDKALEVYVNEVLLIKGTSSTALTSAPYLRLGRTNAFMALDNLKVETP